MKKSLLLFSLSVVLSAKGQTYHPMLDSINRWSYVYNFYPAMSIHVASVACNYPFNDVIMFTNQDTVIDSLVYKQLYSGSCLFGFLREDTAARKIYFQDVDTNAEVLLYDFSMQIGDSISIKRFYTDTITHYYRLDSIKTVSIQAGLRREFFLNCHSCTGSRTLIWTESVGDLENVIYPYALDYQMGGPFNQCPDFPHDRFEFIICLEHNQIAYYDSCAYQTALADFCFAVVDTCDYYNTCSSISGPTPQLSSLSPNPFHSTATLGIKNEELKIKNSELRIYDVFGRIVQRQIINNQSTIINRDGLGDGLYFYRLTNSDGLMLTGKFVIE